MSNVSLVVDNDMINNPFWEVRMTIEEGASIETKEAILLARQALPQVDKIVILWKKVPISLIFKKTMSGIVGWERSFLEGTLEDIFKLIDWKSCRELGVEK